MSDRFEEPMGVCFFTFCRTGRSENYNGPANPLIRKRGLVMVVSLVSVNTGVQVHWDEHYKSCIENYSKKGKGKH